MLLARPNYDKQTHIETICDKDGFVANVWRGLKFDPDEVAKWCDWPVNHAELSSRKKRLLENEDRLLENLIADDEWFDVKIAGYWIWAASCWIGSGLTRLGQIPYISHGGKGVHALGQRPHIGDCGNGVHALGGRNHNIYDWFVRLQDRLRYVRVVCGDWTRVCGGDWQDNIGTVGIFFDPPYGVQDRDTNVYHHDSTSLAADVCHWALERGSRESYRIVIAGYDEHADLLEHGWRMKLWKANGGYGNLGKKTRRGAENAHRECLYFSPHCLENREMALLFE